MSWWMAALSCRLIVAASPRFFCSVRWEGRAGLSLGQWASVGFLLLLEAFNLAVWKLRSTYVWVNFQFFVPLPVLAACIAGLVPVLRGQEVNV